MYKVLKDFKGSPDGYTVIEYHEGEVVPLPHSLAEVAIAEKWVEEVAVDAAPEGDAAPAPEGDAAPAPEGDAAPAPEGDAAPAPEGDAAPAPEGDAAPAPEGDAAPAPEGAAQAAPPKPTRGSRSR